METDSAVAETLNDEPAVTPEKTSAPVEAKITVVESKTASEAAPEKPAEKDVKAYWPADWRQTVSKDDAKKLARLERYASPEAAMDALIAAQNRISAGELKPVLGKNATPEQKAEWREAHGIPATPDKYDLNDIKVDVADQEALNKVLEAAHSTDQTPDQVKATLLAWNTIRQSALEKRAEQDIELQTKGEDALRAEWGPEFRRNINLIHGMLDGAGSQQLKEAILNGRLADGTPIGSSPEALKWLVSLALINNPSGVVVPSTEGTQMDSLETEIGKIEKTMRENRQAYNKDEKMQSRYRELLGARETMRSRQK